VIGWRFLFSRQWAGYLALTILFAVVCAGLGMWQLDRRGQALAEIALVQQNFDSEPVPIAQALPSLGAFDESQKWLRVTVSGTYLTDHTMLVRNRPLNGNPGFEELVPLQLDDGTVFVVDRGWLPTGQRQDAPDVVPEAPAGPVTVTARLTAGEPTIAGRSASGHQIATIHLPEIEGRVDAPTYTGAYGLLATEDPAPAQRPVAVTKPIPDEGPHLSYAFQWFTFGVLGFAGLIWAARQEFRSRNADDPEERERAAERARRKAAKPRSDAEVEDELLGHR
jgi:cytochrome oxidase assembly protein ShyY1